MAKRSKLSDVLTVPEAAAEMRVTERRVRQMCASGVLRSIRPSPRLILIVRDSLASAEARNKKPGRPKKKTLENISDVS